MRLHQLRRCRRRPLSPQHVDNRLAAHQLAGLHCQQPGHRSLPRRPQPLQTIRPATRSAAPAPPATTRCHAPQAPPQMPDGPRPRPHPARPTARHPGPASGPARPVTSAAAACCGLAPDHGPPPRSARIAAPAAAASAPPPAGAPVLKHPAGHPPRPAHRPSQPSSVPGKPARRQPKDNANRQPPPPVSPPPHQPVLRFCAKPASLPQPTSRAGMTRRDRPGSTGISGQPPASPPPAGHPTLEPSGHRTAGRGTTQPEIAGESMEG